MSTRTTVVWVPDWPVVAAAAVAGAPGTAPTAVHDGRQVTAASALARAEGVRRGMRRRQAQACCPGLVLLPADEARDVRVFEPVAAAVEQVVAGVEVVRAGLLLLPAGGAARYHGGEEALAELLVDTVARQTGHECGVGTADGLLAAVLAARTGVVVEPGTSAVLLAPHGVGEVVHATVTPEQAAEVGRLVDLLNRLGLRTLGAFAALPSADVHSRFGRLGTWVHTLARGLDERPPALRRPEADLEVGAELDPPVDRVDTAAFAGRRLAEELHDLLVAHGAGCGRLQVAARTDEGHDLVRTWRTDLGGWGGLTPARITDRIRWQLEGWLTASAVATAADLRAAAPVPRPGGAGREHDGHDPGPDDDARTVALVRLTLTALDVASAGAEQGRLWGGASGGDLRAHRALERAQSIVGGAGVLTVALQGGRDVRDQVHVRPWGEQVVAPRDLDRPWPGRLPDPPPATVPSAPLPVDVRDGAGRPVELDARGTLSGPPTVVHVAGRSRRVAGWGGPWLLTDRWWSRPGRTLQVRAHLQVAFDDGGALLLTCTGRTWTCEGDYD